MISENYIRADHKFDIVADIVAYVSLRTFKIPSFIYSPPAFWSLQIFSRTFRRQNSPQNAQQGATRGVRSKFAPFQRRETSAASQMTSGNTSDNGAFDDEGVLRTWRAMCPNLQEKWPEAARPEDWEGVTMENGRVVKLVLGLFWPERRGAD